MLDMARYRKNNSSLQPEIILVLSSFFIYEVDNYDGYKTNIS
jgi:hypothetical protein